MPAKEAWGLDIGQCGVRLVKMERAHGEVVITDFATAELSCEEDDPERLDKLEEALEELVDQKEIGKQPVCVSVPGPLTLFRDFPLPAMSSGKLDEIVSYEARQQIPYPLEEVHWDYHQNTPEGEEAAEISISLVCCRRESVQDLVDMLQALELNVTAIQVGPVALANFLLYDQPPEGTTLVLDAGARATDFLILNEGNFWLRSISDAGNELTHALMSKFDMPFDEAEQLKRQMGESKQAERVFQVVAPVLRNIAGEIQRSLGYYKSLYRGVRVGEVVAAGGTFLLPDVDQFIAEDLGLPVKTLAELQAIELDPEVEGRGFADQRQVLGTAIGLALQAVGEAEIDINLLPPEIQRRQLIRAKVPYAAAAVLLAGAMTTVSLLTAKESSTHGTDLIDRMDEVVDDRSGTVAKVENALKRAVASLEEPEKINRALARIGDGRGLVLQSCSQIMETLRAINETRRAEVQAQTSATSLAEDMFEEEAVQEKLAEAAEETADPEKLRQSVLLQFRRRAQWLLARRRQVFVKEMTTGLAQETWYWRETTERGEDGQERTVRKLLAPRQAETFFGDEDDGDGRPRDGAAERELPEGFTPQPLEVATITVKGFAVGRTENIADVDSLPILLRDRPGVVSAVVSRQDFATNKLPMPAIAYASREPGPGVPEEGEAETTATTTSKEKEAAWETIEEDIIPFTLELVLLPPRYEEDFTADERTQRGAGSTPGGGGRETTRPGRSTRPTRRPRR
jgi:type IV pilus assembly protein PilM